MVWLGIDLGDARVGLALSDPGITLAHPAGNIQVYGGFVPCIGRGRGRHRRRIGRPCGSRIAVATKRRRRQKREKARRWTVNLEKRLRVAVDDENYALKEVPSIELVDERLTTVTAHHQLFDAQVGGRKHRPMVDQQSAVVILQTAIDRRERPEERGL